MSAFSAPFCSRRTTTTTTTRQTTTATSQPQLLGQAATTTLHRRRRRRRQNQTGSLSLSPERHEVSPAPVVTGHDMPGGWPEPLPNTSRRTGTPTSQSSCPVLPRFRACGPHATFCNCPSMGLRVAEGCRLSLAFLAGKKEPNSSDDTVPS